MALPPTFSNRVRLQAGRVADRYAAPSVLGQVASVVGRTMGQIGEQDAEAERQIAVSQQRVREREIARDREVQDVELTEKFVNLQMDRTKQARDLEENYTSGQDMAGAVTKLYEDSDSAFLDQIGDEELRGKYQVMLAKDRAAALDRADIFMRKARADRETDAIIGIQTTLGNKLVALGPEGTIKDFDDAEATVQGAVTKERFGERQPVIMRKLMSGLADNYLAGRLLSKQYKAAREAITSGRFAGYLDPSTAEMTLRRIDQAEAAETRAQVSAVSEAAGVLVSRVNDGGIVQPDQMQAALQVAVGANDPSQVEKIRDAMVRNQVNIEFGDADATGIATAIAEIDRDPKWRQNIDKVRQRTQLEKLRSNLNGATPAYAAVDPFNADSVLARRSAARQDQQRTGKAVADMLTPEEVENYRDRLGQGDTSYNGVADELAAWAQTDPSGAASAARKVAPDDMLLRHAIGLSADTRRTVLAGRAAMKANPDLAMKEDKLNRIMVQEVGGALRDLPPDSVAAVGAAARAMAAGTGFRAGQATVNDDDMGKAIHAVLGGGYDQRGRKIGGMGEWRSGKVLLPTGMSEDEFDRRLSGFQTLTNAYDDNRRPISAKELREKFRPVAIGGGRYHWVDAHGDYVLAANGTAMVLDVRAIKPRAAVKPPNYTGPALKPGGSLDDQRGKKGWLTEWLTQEDE